MRDPRWVSHSTERVQRYKENAKLPRKKTLFFMWHMIFYDFSIITILQKHITI